MRTLNDNTAIGGNNNGNKETDDNSDNEEDEQSNQQPIAALNKYHSKSNRIPSTRDMRNSLGWALGNRLPVLCARMTLFKGLM